MPTTDTTHFDAPVAAQDMAAASEAFLSAHPAYASTSRSDDLRATKYARQNQQRQVYLDYTGGDYTDGGLYAEAQAPELVPMLTSGVFGNPHSKNVISLTMTERACSTHEYALRYLNASPDECMTIFAPNSTGALKLSVDSLSNHRQTKR